MKFLILIFFLILISNEISFGFEIIPDIREKSEWHLSRRPAPVAKINVYYTKFIDVVIGNPGHVTRLQINFGCQDTIILFNTPEDNSLTWSEHPHTLIVYLGPVLIRVSFRVDITQKDFKSYYPYEGYLCLGKQSDIWQYWSKLTVSPYRIIFGEYDESLSRITFDPFLFTFHKNESQNNITTLVNNHEYPLLFNLSDEYTTLPRKLYHNISLMDISIDNIHFDIEREDFTVHLINGFDRTMLRKSYRHDDNRIIFGQNFIRNFVIYHDIISSTTNVMPSFDLFNYGNSEPFYSVFSLTLFLSITIVWTAIIFVKNKEKIEKKEELISSNIGESEKPQTDEHHIKPEVFSTLELYTYLCTILFLFIDVGGLAGYRHFNFLLHTSSNTYYITLTIIILCNTLIGIPLSFYNRKTYKLLNLRRVFLETSLFTMLWLLNAHYHKTHSFLFLTTILTSFYTITRLVQFIMCLMFHNFLMKFVTGIYSVFSIVFFVYFVSRPVINFFFFKFNDQTGGVLITTLFLVFIPSFFIVAWLPLTILSNTICFFIDTNKKIISHEKGVNQNRPEQLTFSL